MTEGISIDEALRWIRCDDQEVTELLALANRRRWETHGNRMHLCAIVNAKSGGCSQDCAFCAQSSHHRATIERYPMLSADELIEAGRLAVEHGATRFSLVTSGRAVTRPRERAIVLEAISRIRDELGVSPCASLGHVSPDFLGEMRQAGLERYHHNLETAESHWGEVCTTRRYSDHFETLSAAREAGLELCSGGIFGLGEDPAQRVELLAKIRELGAASVPLNFLHPIAGTPLAGAPPIPPLQCLRAVAVARLMMPEREIRICGGREHSLRDLQSWVLAAGADGMMIGHYLTTRGREMSDDLRMIEDAGLSVEPAEVARS